MRVTFRPNVPEVSGDGSFSERTASFVRDVEQLTNAVEFVRFQFGPGGVIEITASSSLEIVKGPFKYGRSFKFSSICPETSRVYAVMLKMPIRL